MIGITMRHCLDCGLHRKSNTVCHVLDQRRKRLFWTVYMLERSVARTVGRPCSVADREIDVSLPANVDDSIDSEDEMIAAIQQSVDEPGQVTSLSAAIHIIRIQQLESKIHRTVYCVDRPIAEIAPHKISKLRSGLDAWKAEIPTATRNDVDGLHPYDSHDYYLIQYHKALLLLFLPFLPSMSPSHPDFRLCAFTAGQICQAYKRLHDHQHYISFSLLALHANFVAGLTMIYCFCMDQSLFDAQFSGGIRACSAVLYAIAERWSAVREVRNAFESLVSATIERRMAERPPAPSEGQRTIGDERGGSSTDQGDLIPTQQLGADGMESGHPPAHEPDNMWDMFETVLEDYQLHSERWMQDGLFQAMDSFPQYGWAI